MSKKIIIIFLALLLVLGFLFWRFGPDLFNKTQIIQGPVTLTYWGLWEEDNLIRPLIADYQSKFPNIKISYVRQSSTNYRTRVQTQIREDQGPDLFRIHNSWLPMFISDLSPAPSDIYNPQEFRNTFYQVASDSFIRNDKVYAAPIEIDGLALYINEDILTAAAVSPPKNWQDFVNSAVKMTVKDATGTIKTAGAAMGNTSNVDHWSDIIGLLIYQQPGANLTTPATTAVAEVLQFYTGFITDSKKKTWDVSMPNSTLAFAQGRLAFYFAPSWRAHEIRQANPNLKFKIVSVPQLPGKTVNWATYWGEAVSAKSQNQKEAWKFIKYLTSKEAQKLGYAEAAKIRLFGEPYSRVDLASEITNDPLVGAYVTQAPFYKSWYLSSNTFDAGINDKMIKYFEDAINATLQGQDPQIALQTTSQGVQQVLNDYTKPTQR